MKVKELLADPNRWTQENMALDEWGEPIDPTEPDAVCFCLYGALSRCYPSPNARVAATKKLKSILFNELGDDSIIDFNDGDKTTHEDLMRVLEKADV